MILWTLGFTCHCDHSVCLEVNGSHDLYSCICLHIDHSSCLLDYLVDAFNQHPLARRSTVDLYLVPGLVNPHVADLAHDGVLLSHTGLEVLTHDSDSLSHPDRA